MIMGFKEIINKLANKPRTKQVESEEYLELDIERGAYGSVAEAPERYVKVCKLKGFADVDNSARELSEGNIVILDLHPLAERSMTELKHAVDEMKEVCISMGGDIAGLSEYHLIMTPPNLRIERGSKESFETAMDRVQKATH